MLWYAQKLLHYVVYMEYKNIYLGQTWGRQMYACQNESGGFETWEINLMREKK